jgi:hypothetical protein
VPTNSNLNSNQHFGDMINEVEDSVRESLRKLNDWADQARTVLDEKPSTIVSSLAVAGFMAGALLRRGNYGLSNLRQLGRGKSVDPLLILGIGAVMGWAFGPRLMSESSRTASPTSRPSHVSDSRH